MKRLYSKCVCGRKKSAWFKNCKQCFSSKLGVKNIKSLFRGRR